MLVLFAVCVCGGGWGVCGCVCVCGSRMLICFVSALGSHEMGRHKLPIIIIIIIIIIIKLFVCFCIVLALKKRGFPQKFASCLVLSD